MGWNGSGTFTRSYDWTNERDAGYNIDAAKFDTENDNFTTGINACLAKNGENAATGDLPMGGNKHTGVGEGTTRTHYASVGQVQDSSVVWGGTSGGAANVQTITLSPAPTAYIAGMQIAFLPGFNNTAAVTLNVNGLGAKSIKQMGQNVLGLALRTDSPVVVVYDGTDFELISSGLRQFCDLYDFSTAQTIANGATDALDIASETSDLWGMHSTSSNEERINLTAGGLWAITASVAFTAVGGSSYLHIYINGATTYHKVALLGTRLVEQVTGFIYSGAVTDYITIVIENGSGSDIIVSTLRVGAVRLG